MAGRVVDQGLQRIGVQASQATSGAGPTYSATRHIQVMSLDDGAGDFVAANDDCTDPGAVTNFFDAAFTSTPTRSGLVITHVVVFATTEGNFVIRKVCLHDNVIASVSATSTTLVAGVTSQSITGTADFTKTFTETLTLSNV